MKVLICHNSYQQAGGEDAVVNAEYQLLKSHGIEIEQHIVSNHTIKGLLSKLKASLFLTYSKTSKKQLEIILDKFKPDIVHFHNTFPLLTASVYDACIEKNIPVVQTLHNYRFICPTALLMLDGKPCEKSLQQPAYWAVPYKVYRNSYIGTFLLARMIEAHKHKNTWQNKVNRYIALTQFAKDKFVSAGFPADKIIVKPNFSSIKESPELNIQIHSYALFVGRFSEEKGIRTLLKAFTNIDVPIKIAGSGPLFDELNDDLPDNITLLGEQNHETIFKLMQDAQFLILPSECYEGFPMVIAEAFSQGLPVLCSKLGSMAEIVEHGINGMHFEAGNADDLAAKSRELFDSPELCLSLGKAAYDTYSRSYTPEINFNQLISIYQDAINEQA